MQTPMLAEPEAAAVEEAAVEAAVEGRLSTQKKSFEGYGVEQTKLLKSAIEESKGYYVLLAVSKEADRIDTAFKKSIH